MAIVTNAQVDFSGTREYLNVGGAASTTTVVPDTTFSGSADAVIWSNSENAPWASFVLVFSHVAGAVDNKGIHLFARRMNVSGANDEPAPSAAWPNAHLGTFPTDTTVTAGTTVNLTLGPVRLPKIVDLQDYEFHLNANFGQTIAAGWTLEIIPSAIGPHA